MKYLNIAAPISLLILLSACTSTQLVDFTNQVDNFIIGVHKVDEGVAAVNVTLYKNCGNIQSVGASVATLPKTCSKAGLALKAINASIDNYCQSQQVTNISTAVQASASAYNAAQTAYADAKKACKS